MSHRFDRTGKDPYVESARQIERYLFSGRGDYARGAEDEIYETLSNAIVSALGDIAAVAYRRGVSAPDQMKNLARAVSSASEAIMTSYRGEVDPEAALNAVENDSRRQSLPPVDADKLTREIEKTRQLEHLLLNAMRIPELIDYANSLGLHVQDGVMDEGTLLIGEHPTPAPENT